MTWIEEIVAAMESLGGAARYADLYELIKMTTNHHLTREWKATVRRTIEDHSSDSANFRSEDIFQHVSHGHWKLRDVAIDEIELARREKLEPIEVIASVFVREHWRHAPKQAFDRQEQPTRAWLDGPLLRVALADGREIATPIQWYPKLREASPIDMSTIEVTSMGLHWPRLNEDLSIRSMLDGQRPE